MDISGLQKLQSQIKEIWGVLQLDKLRQQVVDLAVAMNAPGFWQQQPDATAVSQKLNSYRQELVKWESLQKEVDEALEMAALVVNENDRTVVAEMEQELSQKTTELQKRFAQLEFYMMLGGAHDSDDAIVSIRAGAGGVDAQDWAAMLLRMILRFCEKKGWSVDIIDQSTGQEAGIKSATLRVHGRFAYGYLQSENGVHRLVRISPFDAAAMRHTSFAAVEVIPDLGEIPEIEIKDHELRIDVFRSSGHGGQSVNTTDSAVRIVHLPTNITVNCQNEKSQHQNKLTALHILKAKLYKKKLDEQAAAKKKLRGAYAAAEWGSQIRSYVLHPYKMVKDHRTKYEVKDPDQVLDGGLQNFMEAYLKWKAR